MRAVYSATALNGQKLFITSQQYTGSRLALLAKLSTVARQLKPLKQVHYRLAGSHSNVNMTLNMQPCKSVASLREQRKAAGHVQHE
jgi:hypothetical protein